MEFGRVNSNELEKTDFTLPEDHPDNSVVLERGKKGKPHIYIGCAKWGRPDWVGKLYPKGTRERDFLHLYAGQFNSIELNPTHYRIPEPSLVKKWVDTVPEDFMFCPKVYQGISHWDRLQDRHGTTERFCEAIRHFGKHLGLVFLQMHPSFKPPSYEVLEAYLSHWPKDIGLSLELRDPGWFHNQNISDRLFHLMRTLNVASVITDTSGFRELVHMRLATPEVFVRFVGNSLHPTDYTRIDDWIDRIGEWLHMGLEKLWFFMHQHEELHSPELIRYMALEMNKKLNLKVKVPKLISDDQPLTLF